MRLEDLQCLFLSNEMFEDEFRWLQSFHGNHFVLVAFSQLRNKLSVIISMFLDNVIHTVFISNYRNLVWVQTKHSFLDTSQWASYNLEISWEMRWLSLNSQKSSSDWVPKAPSVTLMCVIVSSKNPWAMNILMKLYTFPRFPVLLQLLFKHTSQKQ